MITADNIVFNSNGSIANEILISASIHKATEIMTIIHIIDSYMMDAIQLGLGADLIYIANAIALVTAKAIPFAYD